jgi:small ligand-binding sensory domain FIST
VETVDFAALFVTEHHADQIATIAELITRELEPGRLIGCTGESVLAYDREIEEGPGLALLVGSLPDVVIHPFRIGTDDWEEALSDVRTLAKLTGISEQTRGIMLLGDPYTTPAEELIRALDEVAPGAAVFGGMASASRPGGNRLLMDSEIDTEGLIGLTFSGDVRIDTVVSQGCRPIGERMLVTRADGQLIESLGGQRALEAARTLLNELSDDDRFLAAQGLFMGIAMNEYQTEFHRGDFLIRNVMGAIPDSGAVAIAGMVRAGQTVQFHVRDSATADEDLRELLEVAVIAGIKPAGALMFTCNGRGSRMFDLPHHDVSALCDMFPGLPVAGFFAAGEIGRVGRRTFLHGHTASIALFSREPG